MMKARNRPLARYWLGGHGHSPSVYRAILTDKPFPIRALIVEANNPLLGFPNTKLIYEAMRKVAFHVNMDIFMTPSALLADYVLPAACYLEKPYMSEWDFFSFFDVSEAAINPLYERKPEYYFWRELGLRLGQKEYWPWKTLEEAYDYRLAPMGLTFKQAAERGTFHSAVEFKKYEKKGFGTPTGKVELYNTTLEELGLDPLPGWQEWSHGLTPALTQKYPLILITGARNIVYSLSNQRQIISVRKRSPDPRAQLNPAKAQELGIDNGDWVWIETHLGRVKFKCQYFEGILPNVVSAEYGWWFPEDPAQEPSLHGLWKSNINAVLPDDPDSCDPATGAWVLKGVRCKVYKAMD